MSPENLASNPVLVSIGVSLLHFVWQGALVAAVLAVVLGRARRAAPALRYGVACLGLLVMAVLPVATFLWITSVGLQEAPLGAVAGSDRWGLSPVVSEASRPGGLPVAPLSWAMGTSPASIPRDGSLMGRLGKLSAGCAPWLALLWGIGVACLSARMAAGLAYLVWVKRQRGDSVGDALCDARSRLCDALGITRTVEVIETASISVPSVVGLLRPVVLVPASAVLGLPADQLEALLAHELAHIRRWDHAINVVQCLVEILLFYHPAVWWVSRRIRIEREYCCDDIAASLCGGPVRYVRALAAIAGLRNSLPAVAAGADGGSLLGRVRRLIETPRAGDAAPARGWAGALSLAVLVVGIGLFHAYTAKPARAATGPRSVYFPPDKSVGQLYVQDTATPVFEFTVTEKDEGWKSLGQAQGEVLVPDGKALMLRVESRDLSFLAELNPDDLRKLDLSELGITDADLKHVEGLTGLQALNLSRNKGITDAGLAVLEEMSSLKWLGLEQTAIGTTGAPSLRMFPELEYLDVYASNLDDEGLANLAELTSLRWLGLEDTKITGAGLAHLRKLVALQGIRLEDTKVDDEGMAHLAHLTALRYLTIRNTPVTDAGVAHLRGLTGLQQLEIGQTRVTNACVPSLFGLKELETLMIDQTPLDDSALAELLPRLPKLVSFQCEGTKVTPEFLAQFKRKAAERVAGLAQAGSRTQRSTNPEAPKVGVVMSHFTATGPHWIANPYGYESQNCIEMVSFLDEANFDVYAVIEPGTEHEGELPRILEATGLVDKLVVGTDPEALKQLDVVVSHRFNNVVDPMLAAMENAIKSGVGYVCFKVIGNVTPGSDNETLQTLNGIKDLDYRYLLEPLECPVLASHPILGNLKPGDTVTVENLNGQMSTSGKYPGTQLLGPPEKIGPNFCPMYVFELGNGRVVRCMFYRLLRSPWSKYEFQVRCVNWAAKQPPDATW